MFANNRFPGGRRDNQRRQKAFDVIDSCVRSNLLDSPDNAVSTDSFVALEISLKAATTTNKLSMGLSNKGSHYSHKTSASTPFSLKQYTFRVFHSVFLYASFAVRIFKNTENTGFANPQPI